MRFPERELEVVQLAQDVSRGLREHPESFPAPPIAADALDEAIASYAKAREAGLAAQARAKEQTTAKQKALVTLAGAVRSDLKYAESLTNGSGGRLRLVGWGPPRKAVRTDLEMPGQVGTLEVRQEGSGWVALGWKAPFDGGAVSAYRVQRRRRDAGGWVDVGTSVDTAVKLDGQEVGVEMEYQVIGINGAGEGPASNIVRVVL